MGSASLVGVGQVWQVRLVDPVCRRVGGGDPSLQEAVGIRGGEPTKLWSQPCGACFSLTGTPTLGVRLSGVCRSSWGRTQVSLCVIHFLGCPNKAPHTRGLKTTEMCSLTVPEARSPKRRGLQGRLAPVMLGKPLPPHPVSAGGRRSLVPLACGHIPPASFPSLHGPFQASSPTPSLTGQLPLGLGPTGQSRMCCLT